MGIRFAPSPTGRFHVGNLRTAWVSHEWARSLGLPWVVRFEDIDVPRVLPGAMGTQLSDLRVLGLVPDQVVIQSERAGRHREAFETALREGWVYPCTCSRSEVQEALAGLASAPHTQSALYNGRCRRGEGLPAFADAPGFVGWRFRDADPSGTRDFLVARTSPDLSAFVPAYHWACAIDDLDGGYALLVRAFDLETAAPLQRAIQRRLLPADADWKPSAVFHASLVVQGTGQRLEKRTAGVTLPELAARQVSPRALLDRFRPGFSADPEAFEPSKVWGEPVARIRLSELGL